MPVRFLGKISMLIHGVDPLSPSSEDAGAPVRNTDTRNAERVNPNDPAAEESKDSSRKYDDCQKDYINAQHRGRVDAHNTRALSKALGTQKQILVAHSW